MIDAPGSDDSESHISSGELENLRHRIVKLEARKLRVTDNLPLLGLVAVIAAAVGGGTGAGISSRVTAADKSESVKSVVQDARVQVDEHVSGVFSKAREVLAAIHAEETEILEAIGAEETKILEAIGAEETKTLEVIADDWGNARVSIRSTKNEAVREIQRYLTAFETGEMNIHCRSLSVGGTPENPLARLRYNAHGGMIEIYNTQAQHLCGFYVAAGGCVNHKF